jgi:hypothetical protein
MCTPGGPAYGCICRVATSLVAHSSMAWMIQDEAEEGMDVSGKELMPKMSEVCDICIKAKQAAVSYP